MAKALDGIRILDMTHVQSGPTCTQILAWFGADVIKVELPGRGDITRGQLRDKPNVDSLYFTMLNCNKRSITINTKHEKGKEVFRKLIKACDVMVENFAPGALDRQGFTWEVMHELNPRLIYASVKGFGPGPYEDCKVYENVAQCTGGAASTTGFDDGPPVVTGAQIGDSGSRHSSRRGYSRSAVSAREIRSRTAGHLRYAGHSAQSLPCQAARSTKTRRGTADGVSAISQRRLRRCRAARGQCIGRRPAGLGGAHPRRRTERLYLRHHSTAGLGAVDEALRPARAHHRS